MSKLNKPLCATEFGNTGRSECYFDPGKIKGAFQVPKDFAISGDDISTLQDFLNDKAVAASLGTRIFPYHGFNAITDNTEEPTFVTTDYGDKIFIKDGFYDFTFRYQEGGVMLHQEIQKNGGAGKYFIFYDDSNHLLAYRVGSLLKGIPVNQFRPLPWRMATGADAAQYLLKFIIDPIYMNKGNLGFVPVTEFNLFDIVGLQTVVIELEDVVGQNVLHVSLSTLIGGIDLYDQYSAALVVGAWVATNKKTGASIAITGVTLQPSTKRFIITLNSAAVNAMDPGDVIGLKLVGTDVLAAAPYNMVGYESNELLYVIPAS